MLTFKTSRVYDRACLHTSSPRFPLWQTLNLSGFSSLSKSMTTNSSNVRVPTTLSLPVLLLMPGVI